MGNYGIFLTMGDAGFIASAVSKEWERNLPHYDCEAKRFVLYFIGGVYSIYLSAVER